MALQKALLTPLKKYIIAVMLRGFQADPGTQALPSVTGGYKIPGAVIVLGA